MKKHLKHKQFGGFCSPTGGSLPPLEEGGCKNITDEHLVCKSGLSIGEGRMGGIVCSKYA